MWEVMRLQCNWDSVWVFDPKNANMYPADGGFCSSEGEAITMCDVLNGRDYPNVVTGVTK